MRAMDWRNRNIWIRAGYVLTVIWIVVVFVATGGNMAAPLFDYIFIVPLAGWLLGVTVARLIDRGK
jgi:hypothetical protein